MDEHEFLAQQFEEHRAHLRAVAYRMLGSLSEADDAVQEAWLRLSRSDTSDVENLRGWLTTVVARVCLNVLRSRRTRARGAAGRPRARPDRQPRRRRPARARGAAGGLGRAGAARRAGDAGAGRAAGVRAARHVRRAVRRDRGLVDRSPAATRQLASRARRRVQGAAPVPDADLAASAPGRRRVLRRRARRRLRGARRGARSGRRAAGRRRPRRLRHRPRRARGGRAGAHLRAALTVRPAGARQRRRRRRRGPATASRSRSWASPWCGGRIVEIDAITDPERLRALDLAVLDD